MIRPYSYLIVLTCLFSAVASAETVLPEITWPTGWEVQVLPQDNATTQTPAKVSRQRAVKNDANGDPVLVMELTMTEVEPGHEVNLQGVLLEMRKSVQKDFFQGGYQSVCNKIHPATLSRLQALETTCTVTQNGRHVLSQTLVAALDADKAYVFSYAGQAEVYAASQDEIRDARNSLKL
ncbi:DUF4946 domain-containing protein [Pseudomonas brassicacearum]|uniref:DUF4946 domain-containing protein n=1 Tax=Pseudomonas brassicacearum TaxID=930166 RepID=A0A423HA66_9PSED|nr:DUF4946 domain-containing protein [Pseudomonas brassicacearum]RON10108.1 DUF4946 domain-containing protein [Pseudomonas brassicacearum]